jgi:hypothetical protein
MMLGMMKKGEKVEWVLAWERRNIFMLPCAPMVIMLSLL